MSSCPSEESPTTKNKTTPVKAKHGNPQSTTPGIEEKLKGGDTKQTHISDLVSKEKQSSPKKNKQKNKNSPQKSKDAKKESNESLDSKKKVETNDKKNENLIETQTTNVEEDSKMSELKEMLNQSITLMRNNDFSFNDVLQKINSLYDKESIEKILNQSIPIPTRNKRSNKQKDESHLLALAVEIQNEVQNEGFIESLRTFGARDIFSKRGSSALSKAAAIGSTEMISSVLKCAPYNNMKENKNDKIFQEIAHAFVTFLLKQECDKTGVNEAVTIGLLLKLASLYDEEDLKTISPIRKLLDGIAENVVKGNYRLSQKQACPSLVHLVVAKQMPTLLYLILAPILPLSSNELLPSQLQSLETRVEFMNAYMRPINKQGARPEMSALQFAESRYIADRVNIEKESNKEVTTTTGAAAESSEDGDNEDEIHDFSGKGKGRGKGKGKGGGKGKGKGYRRGKGGKGNRWGNKGKSSQAVVASLNKGTAWLCVIIVAEAYEFLDCFDSSESLHDEVVSIALLSHFGIGRVLSTLSKCESTSDGAGQVITALDSIAEFKKLAQRDEALSIKDGSALNWKHFVRSFQVKTSPPPLVTTTASSSFESPKKVKLSVSEVDQVDWATAPFISPQKPKKKSKEMLSPPKVPQDIKEEELKKSELNVSEKVVQADWLDVFGQCGEVHQVQLGRVLRGLNTSSSPYIVPFTEVELIRFQEQDPVEDMDNFNQTTTTSISGENFHFLLDVLLSPGVHPVVLLAWVHILQEVCITFPRSNSTGALTMWRTIIKFLSHMGTLLLYGVTGLCEDESGMVEEEREKNIFESILELCFRLLPLHANEIALDMDHNLVQVPRSCLALVVNELSSDLENLWYGLKSALSVIEGNCYLMPERFGTLLRGHFIWHSLATPTCEDIIKDINDACKLIPIIKNQNRRKGHNTMASLFYSTIRTATTGTAQVGEKNDIFYGLAASNLGKLKGFAGMPLNEPTLKLLSEPYAITAINSLVLTEPNLLLEDLGYIHRYPDKKIIDLKPRLKHLQDLLNSPPYQCFTVHINRIHVSRQEQLFSIVRQFQDHATKDYLKAELEVGYEDEEGTGDGPIREFLTSIGQAFFSTKLPQRDKKDKPTHVFPLFISAPGDQMGGYVVPKDYSMLKDEKSVLDVVSSEPPVEKDVDSTVVDSTVVDGETTLKKHSKKSKKTQPMSGDNEVEALKIQSYRTAGRLLALSIRNNVPMGVSLPSALWHEIMGLGYANWEEYCLHDEEYRKGLKKFLEMNEVELEALDQRFTVTEVIHTQKEENNMKKKNHKQSYKRYTKKQVSGSSEGVGSMAAAAEEEEVSPSLETLPITKDIELLKGGSDIVVKTKKDALKFVRLAARRRLLGPVASLTQQDSNNPILHLQSGFQDVIPKKFIVSNFTSEEFSLLVSGPNLVDVSQWKKLCIYDDDLSLSDPLVKMFWQCIHEDFNEEEKRALLLFWSGSPVAPVFGSSLSNTTTAHAVGLIDEDENFTLGLLRKSQISKGQTNIWCPEVSTCDKTLSIPRYTNKKAMLAALRVALKHGSVGYDRM